MIFRIHKQGRRRTAPPLRLSKKPRRVRARKREEIEICFRPRHVRGRKHISACKRANRPLIADGECAAAGRSLSVEKGHAFFDGLRPGHRKTAGPVFLLEISKYFWYTTLGLSAYLNIKEMGDAR